MAAATGTTDIVATPHANARYVFNPDVIQSKAAEVRGAVKGIINIHTGCDFHLSASNLDDALLHPTKYAINHHSYLLVEFSEVLIPPSTPEIFKRLQDVGIVPVITHPERNAVLQRNLRQVEAWVAQECLVQVTAQTLLGRFGKAAKSAASELMDKGLVHFIASDAHDLSDRNPVLSKAYQFVQKTYGSDMAVRLFVSNPAAALLGDPLPLNEPVPNRGSYWQRLFGKRSPAPLHSSH
jgi:protein-tyrosine phosphatase